VPGFIKQPTSAGRSYFLKYTSHALTGFKQHSVTLVTLCSELTFRLFTVPAFVFTRLSTDDSTNTTAAYNTCAGKMRNQSPAGTLGTANLYEMINQ
jgi:hypothetical protein